MRELHNIKVYVYSINCVVFENDPRHLDLYVYNYLSWNVLQLLVLKISNSCFHVHKLHSPMITLSSWQFLDFWWLLLYLSICSIKIHTKNGIFDKTRSFSIIFLVHNFFFKSWIWKYLYYYLDIIQII